MDAEKNDRHYGEATLLTKGGTWGGIADLHRTGTGWEGTFEFDSVAEADELLQFMTRTHPIKTWPAELQIGSKTPRPTTVTGTEQMLSVSGEGTPPWEDKE